MFMVSIMTMASLTTMRTEKNNTIYSRKRKGNPCQEKSPKSADRAKGKRQPDYNGLRNGAKLHCQEGKDREDGHHKHLSGR
jgi:hypothetical protein